MNEGNSDGIYNGKTTVCTDSQKHLNRFLDPRVAVLEHDIKQGAWAFRLASGVHVDWVPEHACSFGNSAAHDKASELLHFRLFAHLDDVPIALQLI